MTEQAHRVDAVLSEAGDGRDLAWYWAVGDDVVEWRGTSMDWRAHWDEWIPSICAYVDVWQPTVVRDHDLTGPALGVVEATRVLTRDEAAQYGIEQESDRALYVGCRLNDAGRILDADGHAIYASVRVGFDWTDEDGVTHPAVLKEFSITNLPHLKRRQVPRTALQEVRLMDQDNEMMDGAPDSAVVPEWASAIMQSLESINAMLASMQASVSADVEQADEDTDDVAQADAADDTEMSEQTGRSASEIALSEQVAKLSHEIALRDARARVARDAERVHIPDDQREAMALLSIRDDAAYGLAVQLARPRPQTSERVAGAGSPVEEAMSVGELATRIMADAHRDGQTVTFSEAARKASAQLYGGQ